MDAHELKLWIGDWVRVKLTGAIGKFEGQKESNAIVVINGSRQLIEAKFLEVYNEPEPEESLLEQLGIREEAEPVKKKDAIPNTLDLHLEKLSGYSADSGQTILEFQLKECRAFLDEMISRKIGSAIIIHGKGEGILKEQVIHLLGDYPQIKHFFPRNHGGALELLLYY